VPSQAGGAVLHPTRSKGVVGILSAKIPPRDETEAGAVPPSLDEGGEGWRRYRAKQASNLGQRKRKLRPSDW
jgi:hypothetical protein